MAKNKSKPAKNKSKPPSNTDKMKMKKCPYPNCNYVFEVNSLQAHVQIAHVIGLQQEHDSKGKLKMYMCIDCGPLPRLFATQNDLNQHRIDKKHL